MSESILWQRLDLPGHEACTVSAHKKGWQLAGTAVFAYDGMPCELSYHILCDAGWRTASARVAGRVGSDEVRLDISTDGAERWHLNGAVCPAVDGCIDLDLGFSPSTNLLPIRRHALEVGTSAEVVAAWLPFPSLTFEPLAQVYRREDGQTYRYESWGGAFVRVLEVNAGGLVTHYPGLWKAEAATGAD
ncbi:MAG TPA: putative glycolipid-binding domain-containing protein [Rhodothermales bacterium]|nr:putative glycolipid-binding domain-containing protein [Rhodothermales bacterium]